MPTQPESLPFLRETVLDNGIRVVTETVPRVRSVSIGVLINAGPRNERPAQAGLAHFCEHLAFQGTSSRTSTEIARFMDSAGGGLGAFTSHDYTCYTATVLDDYCPFALELLGDILLNSTFPEERVSVERAAVICEIEGEADRPSARTRALMRELAWPGHALGRRVTGSVESVRGLTREDAIYFVHQHYVPSQVVIAAAGRLCHDDFVAAVRDGFWRLLGQSVDTPRSEPSTAGGVRIATQAASALAYFSLGLPAPAYADPDRYAMHVFTQLLGGGISSRLHRRVREERGWAYEISADCTAYRDAGLLTIEGSTSPDTLFPILHLIGDELARLAQGSGLEDDDLQRTQAQISSQVLISGEDMHTRMSRLALQSFYFNRPITESEMLDGILRVDNAAVARVAARCLGAGAAQALAVTGPASLADVLGGGLEGAARSVPASLARHGHETAPS